MDQSLHHEAAVFARHIEEWREAHLGQVVLVKGDDVIGFYSSLEQAFQEGTSRFGLEPFLVRQIVPTDVVNVSFYGRRVHVA